MPNAATESVSKQIVLKKPTRLIKHYITKKMNRISPHFNSKKLEPPFYRDLVDVFEDRMWYWMLNPAKILLNDRHGQIAAVGILINYFEGIEICRSGKDSNGKSKVFFKRGFKRVFSTEGYSDVEIMHVSESLYEQARCGFSHDGIFRNRILFSDLNMNAILTTWPKKNGNFIFENGVESIHINPFRFFEVVEYNFRSYVNALKKCQNEEIVSSFKRAVDLKWGLENEHINIGLPVDKFINNPKYLKK